MGAFQQVVSKTMQIFDKILSYIELAEQCLQELAFKLHGRLYSLLYHRK